MEQLGINTLIELVRGFGVPGIVFIVWYFSERSHAATLKQYREDMMEMRRMYENNVELVKRVTDLAADQRDVLMLNAQGYTRLCDEIRANQYCPMVRLKKDAQGVQS